MSNLIDKSRKNKEKKIEIEKISIPKPNNFFSRNAIFTIEEDKKHSSNTKTTTIRCNRDTSDEINALATTMNFDSVNELLVFAMEKVKIELSPNQKKEFEIIKSIYRKKISK